MNTAPSFSVSLSAVDHRGAIPKVQTSSLFVRSVLASILILAPNTVRAEKNREKPIAPPMLSEVPEPPAMPEIVSVPSVLPDPPEEEGKASGYQTPIEQMYLELMRIEAEIKSWPWWKRLFHPETN